MGAIGIDWEGRGFCHLAIHARHPFTISALAVCLFLAVVGARWAVISRNGMALPEWDQWDAEGINLLVPWYTGELTPARLWQPHNEHRVVLTKAVNLGLTLADGQWDQRLESTVNAILPALVAVGLFGFALRCLGAGWLAPLWIGLAAAYALPIAWENVAHGFHSQQWFLLGLAFATIVWLPMSRPFSWRWWLGAAAAVLGLGSMASGCFAAAVAGGLMVGRILRDRRRLGSAIPGLLVCAAVVAIGVATRVVINHQEGMHAGSVRDFLFTVGRELGWPAFDLNLGFLSLVLWIPAVVLAIRLFRHRADASIESDALVLGLAAWVLLQVLAAGYARGSGGLPPPTRYMDTLIFGLIMNGLCLARLSNEPAVRGRWRRGLAVLAGVWATALGVGGWHHLSHVFRDDLPSNRLYEFYCEQNVRNYLATGDSAYLEHREIPYPGAGGMRARLALAPLRPVLPSSVRLPLALNPASIESGFVRIDTRRAESHPLPTAEPAGLAPDTPVLDNAVFWGSYGPSGTTAVRSWESQPVRSAIRGKLAFHVAGDLGAPGTTLELRDAATHQVLSAVEVDATPGRRWRWAYAPVPRQPFVVVARTEKPAQWLAFSEPVEMGRWSYWAMLAVHRGRWLAGLAIVSGLALLAATEGWRLGRTQLN